MTGGRFHPSLKIGAFVLTAFFLLVCVNETFQVLRYKPYEKELAAAQQAREDGDLQTAEKILLALETKKPDEPAAYIELSYVYEDMGVLDSALKQSQLAWEKVHKSFSRGSILLDRLRLLRWKEILKQRIEDLPLAIHGRDAIRDWTMGDRQSALRKLKSLEKKYPSAYQPQAALAFLYKNSGNAEEAIATAQAAIQKIDAQLALRKVGVQTQKLIEQDRSGLQAMIDELRDFYAEN